MQFIKLTLKANTKEHNERPCMGTYVGSDILVFPEVSLPYKYTYFIFLSTYLHTSKIYICILWKSDAVQLLHNCVL
jgi:hypothetical protein